MAARQPPYSWRIWALSAFALLVLVVAVAAPRLTEEIDTEAGRLRVLEGLSMARAVAGVAEVTAAKDAGALRESAAALMAAGDVRRVFFVSEGGVDDYGIATGREFVYDSKSGAQTIGDADKELLDLVTRVADSAAEKGAAPLPVRELVLTGAAEGDTRRFVVLVPALVEGKVLGVAGVVREAPPYPIPPLFVVGLALALLGAALFVFLQRAGLTPRLACGLAAGVVLVAGVGGGGLFLGQQESRLAALQVEALTRAEAAYTKAVPRAAGLNLDLVWEKAWDESDSRLIARGDDGGYAVREGAAAARAYARLVMPAAVLLLGLVLCVLAVRGTAELVDGVRSQPTTYLYILPVLLAMGAVIFYPFLKGVEFAFLDSTAQNFVGLANFEDVLVPSDTGQSSFYRTLGVTVLWTGLNVVLHVSIGLALALLLNNQRLRFKGLYRVLLVVPWAMPNYITALTWKTMFNTQYGAVNILLKSVGIDGPNWFGPEFVTNFSANLTTNVWLGFPFMMVVSLGALQSIPTDLYEAADIDGAGRWQKFRNVTLPLLKPALFPAIILGTIWTFNQFNVIYLVSGGGPDHKTEILITEAYFLFKVLGQYGLAAAYCLMIFLILLIYTVMTNRITRATEGAFE